MHPLLPAAARDQSAHPARRVSALRPARRHVLRDLNERHDMEDHHGCRFFESPLQPAARLCRRGAQAGRRAARRRRQRAGGDRRPAAARARQRRARPRDGIVDHARRVQDHASPAARCRSARAGSMSTACWPRTTAPRPPTRPSSCSTRCWPRPRSPIRFATTPSPICPTRRRCRPPARHLVYLDVWEREVTHLEQPDLVESAVGVDTSSRAADRLAGARARRRRGQRHLRLARCRRAGLGGADRALHRACSRPAPSTSPPCDDPCELPPTGGYRGLENQLYRVEIHDPGQPGGTAPRSSGRARTRASAAAWRAWSRPPSWSSRRWAATTCCASTPATGSRSSTTCASSRRRRGEMRRITVDEAARRITLHARAARRRCCPAAFPDSVFPRDAQPARRRWDQKGKMFRTGAGGTTSRVPGSRRRRLDRRDRRAGGRHDAAAGERRDGQLRVHRRRRAFAPATTGCSPRARPMRRSRCSTDAPPRGIHHHYARLGIWDVGRRHGHRLPPPVAAATAKATTAAAPPASRRSRTPAARSRSRTRSTRCAQTGGTVCLGRRPVPARGAGADGRRALAAHPGPGPGHGHRDARRGICDRNCVAVAIENLAILSLGHGSRDQRAHRARLVACSAWSSRARSAARRRARRSRCKARCWARRSATT